MIVNKSHPSGVRELKLKQQQKLMADAQCRTLQGCVN